MNNSNANNFDSKENLGHGIKGDTNTNANRLRSDKNTTNNKTENDKSKINDSI